jgi:hypothetical protein
MEYTENLRLLEEDENLSDLPEEIQRLIEVYKQEEKE